MPSILVRMFEHNRWANLRLVEACASVPPSLLEASAEGTYGRAADTLVHLLAAEERYVERLGGGVPTPSLRESEGSPGFDLLRDRAARSGAALVEIAGSIADDAVLRFLWHGEERAVAAATVLVQAINHATEHRVQVATILTQGGVQPPDMSGWLFGDVIA